jgi:hypothetical protein
MTIQDKTIKLAEAAGWRIEKANFHTMHVWEPGAKLPARLGLNMESKLPKYFKDLNAVHKLEKLLTDEQWVIYRDNIRLIVLGPIRMVSQFLKADIHATAAQRCEAIGKTLSLW